MPHLNYLTGPTIYGKTMDSNKDMISQNLLNANKMAGLKTEKENKTWNFILLFQISLQLYFLPLKLSGSSPQNSQPQALCLQGQKRNITRYSETSPTFTDNSHFICLSLNYKIRNVYSRLTSYNFVSHLRNAIVQAFKKFIQQALNVASY